MIFHCKFLKFQATHCRHLESDWIKLITQMPTCYLIDAEEKERQIDAFKWLIILQSDHSMLEPVEIEDKMIKL